MKNQHILYVVLAVTIILLIALAYDSATSKQEGFANKRNGCPISPLPATVIYGKGSTKICCYGKVENGKCVGDSVTRAGSNQCMIGKTRDNVPECNEFINGIKNDIKEFFCPKSMPNAFFTSTGMGCTDGPLNANEDGPLHSSSKHCTVNDLNFKRDALFESIERDFTTNPNSCLVQKSLENLQCIGSKCNKFIRTSPNNKNIIGMDFISPDGIPVTCYDNFAEISEVPNEKRYGMAHPMSCYVAKSLYVDKSMNPANVKLLP